MTDRRLDHGQPMVKRVTSIAANLSQFPATDQLFGRTSGNVQETSGSSHTKFTSCESEGLCAGEGSFVTRLEIFRLEASNLLLRLFRLEVTNRGLKIYIYDSYTRSY